MANGTHRLREDRMHHRFSCLYHRLWSVMLWTFAATAAAQPAADPLDARAPVAPATYVSPLATYKALGQHKVGPWKAANDTVGRIGGWRSYAREAAQPEAPAPAPAASAPADPPSPEPVPASGHGPH
jgi:hypothetical protein